MKKLFKDARNFQIVYLLIFIGYGVLQLGWEAYTPIYLSALLSAAMVQAVLSQWKLGKVKGLKSALITALGLCLLLRTNDVWAMAAASAVGIAAKFFFRVNDKHLFNPSNLGIIVLLLFSNSAWVSPGQWGNGVVLIFLIAATGSIVLFKIGRLDITYVFLGVLFVMEYARTVLYLGWSMDVLLHKFTSGSLLLFAFFMITDPKTTPDRPTSRYIWTIILAIMTFVLSQWFYLYTASIWALFFITPLTILMDRWFPAKHYQWVANSQSYHLNKNIINQSSRSNRIKINNL